MKTALVTLLMCFGSLSVHAADAGKPRRAKTVPGPYPAIIKLPRVPEAPDRPSTGVLLFTTDLSGRDLVFLQTAHETGQRQLALANFAKSRFEAGSLRAVAETLAGTQAAENQQIAKLASLKGLRLATPEEKDLAVEFKGLNGAKLEKKWIDQLAALNEKALTAYESGSGSEDVEIRAFAEGMLPLTQAKLQLTNRLAGRPTN